MKNDDSEVGPATNRERIPLARNLGMNQDLNLLRVLRMLLETNSVSEAARRLDSSQPAVSRMLDRLRHAMGDPLLIKTANRMVSTQRGLELRALLDELAALLEQIYRVPSDYRLDEIRRTCVIGVNDALQAVIGPLLLRKFSELAGRSTLQLVPVSHHNPKQAALDGDLDLLIGISSSEESPLRREEIISCGYMCVSSADHPLRADSLTVADIAPFPYLEASNTGIVTAITDDMFQRAGVKKSSIAAISSFLAVAEVVVDTKALCVLPRYLERLFIRNPGIRCTPVATDVEPHSVSMYWHNAKHFDPFFRDVRALLTEVGSILQAKGVDHLENKRPSQNGAGTRA